MKRRCIGIYAYIKSSFDTTGGIEAQISHQARTLAQLGYAVVIHCLASDDAGICFDDTFCFSSGVREISTNISTFSPKHGPGMAGAIEENLEISRELEEELILCYGNRDGYVFDLAMAVKSELKIPLISFVYFTVEERWFRSHFISRGRSIIGFASPSEKEEYFRKGEDTVRRLVVGSDLIIAPTHYVRAQLLTISGITYSDKVKVCYHGVDENIFRPAQSWRSGGEIIVGARLSIPLSCDKGFLWVAEFAARNRKKLREHGLSICGAGNGKCILESFAKAHNISDFFRVLGFVPQTELANKLRGASYILIPSMMEAGCTVAVEAVLSGTLPLALDSAGLAEMMGTLSLDDYLLESKKSALSTELNVFVPTDEDLLEVLEKSAENAGKVKEHLQEARKIALEKFTIRKTTQRLLQMLNKHRILEAGDATPVHEIRIAA